MGAERQIVRKRSCHYDCSAGVCEIREDRDKILAGLGIQAGKGFVRQHPHTDLRLRGK